MPVIRIEEPDDSRLAPYFNLQSGKHTPDSFIIESPRLVERLLASSFKAHSLLTTENHLEKVLSLAPKGVPLFLASPELLKEVVGFNLHRGCLAHAGAPDTTLSTHLAEKEPRLSVLLEGLADPANVGAIIRNAAAFGADLVICDPKAASPFTRKATRASAGQIFRIPVAIASPENAINQMRAHDPGLTIIATTGRAGVQALDEIPPAQHTMLIFGNEGTGVTPLLREMADICGRINIVPEVDSLNAAAASAVALHIIQKSQIERTA